MKDDYNNKINRDQETLINAGVLLFWMIIISIIIISIKLINRIDLK